MRIGICGSHGVGKTTLLNSLCEKGEEKGLLECEKKITEIGRDIIKEIGNPKEMNERDRATFQIIYFWKQVQAEHNMKHFISDRTLFDIASYTKGLDTYDFIMERLGKYLDYDLVFYIPIEFGLEDDGVRFTGEQFQKKIDENIKKLLKKYKINYVELTGSVEERTQQALYSILQHKIRLKNEKYTRSHNI